MIGAGVITVLFLIILAICIRKIVREKELAKDSHSYVELLDFKERVTFWQQLSKAHPEANTYRIFLWVFYHDRLDALNWGERQSMPTSTEDALTIQK